MNEAHVATATVGRANRFLLAAAAYNAVWGAVACLAPDRLTRWLGFSSLGNSLGWRAAGVMVVAYAPAYLWAAANPRAARPIVATAVFGKSLGALGWVTGVATGRFPRRTILLPLMNDVIWLPGLLHLVRTAGPGSTPRARRQGR